MATTSESFEEFLLDVFSSNSDPESLTTEVLQEKYLKQSELKNLTNKEKDVFAQAVVMARRKIEKQKVKSEDKDSNDQVTGDETPIEEEDKHSSSDEGSDNLQSAQVYKKGHDTSERDSDEEPLIAVKKESTSSSPSKENKGATSVRRVQKNLLASLPEKLKCKTKVMSTPTEQKGLAESTVISETEPSCESSADLLEKKLSDEENKNIDVSSDDEPLSGLAHKMVNDLEQHSADEETDKNSTQDAGEMNSDFSEQNENSDKLNEDDIEDNSSHQDTAKKKTQKDSNETESNMSEDEKPSQRSESTDDSDHSNATEFKQKSSDNICEETMRSSEDEALSEVKAKLGNKRKRESKERDSVEESDSSSDDDKRVKASRKSSKNGKRVRRKSKTEEDGGTTSKNTKGGIEDRRIEKMKRYIRIAGLRVKYSNVFEGCKSVASKVKKLSELLENAGLKGAPTIAKCKKLHKRRLALQEVAELDRSNILETTKGEGRTRRNTRTQSQHRPLTPPSPNDSSTEEVVPVSKKLFSKLKGIVDSEESGSD